MDVKVTGRTVTATIELDEGRPTSTRKSTIMFTTNGYVPIANGMRISINIIAPNEKNDKDDKNHGNHENNENDEFDNDNGRRADAPPGTRRKRSAYREGVRAQPERPGS
ncbi:MAG: hypothetical protein P8181_06890 [bacterium]